MRLWKGKWKYYLDGDCESILLMVLHHDGVYYPVEQVSPDDLGRMHSIDAELPRDRPRYFCKFDDGFWLHPPPDRRYDVVVRYQPHVRER